MRWNYQLVPNLYLFLTESKKSLCDLSAMEIFEDLNGQLSCVNELFGA